MNEELNTVEAAVPETPAETPKKKKKLPIRAYLLYILVATFLCTGVTFSKYVTSGTSEDSARVAKIGEVSITETGDFASTIVTSETVENHLVILPGVNLAKDARLRFDGAEMACYVFMKITPTGWTAGTDHFSFGAGGSGNDRLQFAVDDGWTYLTTEDGSNIYYTVVEANDAISGKAIIEDSVISVSEYLTRTEIEALPALSISFKGTAVQLDGFGDYDTAAEHAMAAWTSVSAH